jgi:hypothetical protein
VFLDPKVLSSLDLSLAKIPNSRGVDYRNAWEFFILDSYLAFLLLRIFGALKNGS